MGSAAAYAETGSGTVTIVDGSTSTPSSTGNYTGSSDGKMTTIPFDTIKGSPPTTNTDSDTVTVGWTRRPSALSADITLFTGDILLSMNVSAIFTVNVTSITLLTGTSGVQAVFTFGTPITLTFGGQANKFGSQVETGITAHSNTLTGSATESNYVTAGGFVFGTSTITGIQLGLAVNQTVDAGKNATSGFQFDAISAPNAASAVPEPSTFALFGLGTTFAGAWVASRRRRAAKKPTA
jgi:hypothetical protein